MSNQSGIVSSSLCLSICIGIWIYCLLLRVSAKHILQGFVPAGFIYDETFQKYEMSVIMFTNKNSGKNLRDKRRIYTI